MAAVLTASAFVFAVGVEPIVRAEAPAHPGSSRRRYRRWLVFADRRERGLDDGWRHDWWQNGVEEE